MAEHRKASLWDRLRARVSVWVETHIIAEDPDPQLSQLDRWDGLSDDKD